MHVLRPASEAEMIAAFLRAEIDSSRFGPEIRALLAKDGSGEAVVTEPRLDDAAANAYRAKLLDRYRAWLRREGLFDGFPDDVAWFRAELAPAEVLDVLYIDWNWWLTLSGGTRSPRDAAERIRAGKVPGASIEGDEPIAARLRTGGEHELIVVTPPGHTRFVLVEGHVRLTAYALFPQYLPDRLEVLLGVSARIAEWCQF